MGIATPAAMRDRQVLTIAMFRIVVTVDAYAVRPQVLETFRKPLPQISHERRICVGAHAIAVSKMCGSQQQYITQ